MAVPDGQCPVLRWQTRQMARAVVDNTINQVLEDMGFTPPPENEEDIISFDIFPAAHTHNREGIENQAVLMAIQSHGLQKPCVCTHPMNSPPPTEIIPFHHRPSTPLPFEPPVCAPSTSEPPEKYTGEADFLAQAVAVAIQKKGLGSYSQTDHG